MQQGAVLFLNEDDGISELLTAMPGNPFMAWEREEQALYDLAADGLKGHS